MVSSGCAEASNAALIYTDTKCPGEPEGGGRGPGQATAPRKVVQGHPWRTMVESREKIRKGPK